MASEFAQTISRFLTTLDLGVKLPKGFGVLDPYQDPEVRRVVRSFAETYYAGDHPRTAIWGINPGRFGAGVTGLSFTDPYALTDILGMQTTIEGRRELSAEFVWMVIEAYGGAEKFYHDFFVSALSPLGFIKDGKNINFYDDARFQKAIEPRIIEWVREQQGAGLHADRCIVLGTGKLKDVMEKKLRPYLDYEHVDYLEHPRFIMQYRRKRVGEYVDKYVETLLRNR